MFIDRCCIVVMLKVLSWTYLLCTLVLLGLTPEAPYQPVRGFGLRGGLPCNVFHQRRLHVAVLWRVVAGSPGQVV